MDVIPGARKGGTSPTSAAEDQAIPPSDPRREVLRILREFGYERRDAPFKLSSGQLSRDYIDGKRALGSGERLTVVGRAILQLAGQREIDFDSVGGLTMGADPIAHAISVLKPCDWFSVRKEQKEHGKQAMVEGSLLKAGARVLLVDDVVTTGRSITKALDAIKNFGARVVMAVSLCDRGTVTRPLLENLGIPYEPLVTYEDLGIEPVSGG